MTDNKEITDSISFNAMEIFEKVTKKNALVVCSSKEPMTASRLIDIAWLVELTNDPKSTREAVSKLPNYKIAALFHQVVPSTPEDESEDVDKPVEEKQDEPATTNG